MKIKYAECEACKKEKAIYCKGKCQNCYWKSRRKIAESKERKPREAKNYKPIRKVSAKMQKALSIYRPLRDWYMKNHLMCEVTNCNKPSQDLHHKAKRGKNLCNAETFMSVCRNHHTWIHDNHKESVELGYILHS